MLKSTSIYNEYLYELPLSEVRVVKLFEIIN